MQTYRKIFACKKNQHVYPKDCHHPPHLTQLTAKNHMVPTLKPCRQHQQCPMCGKPQLHKASVKTGNSQSTRCWAVIRWNENTGMMTAPGWSVSSHNPAVWRYFHMGNRSGSSHWALRVVTCCQQAHTRVPFPRFPCCQNVISGRLPKPTHGCPRLIVQPLWKQSILWHTFKVLRGLCLTFNFNYKVQSGLLPNLFKTFMWKMCVSPWNIKKYIYCLS